MLIFKVVKNCQKEDFLIDFLAGQISKLGRAPGDG